MIMKFKHIKTGNIYTYKGVGKMKVHDIVCNHWLDCIYYEKDNHVYCRDIEDFFTHFEYFPQNLNDNARITCMNDIDPVKIVPNTEEDGTTQNEIVKSRESCRI